MSNDHSPRTLGTVFFPDFELLDVYGPLEMFGSLANEVRIVAIAEQAGPVRSAQGPATLADYGFDDCPDLDLLIVPGGFGSIAQGDNPRMLDFLRTQAATVEIVMSVCSGSGLLAKAGVLDGVRATTNKQFFSLVAAEGPKVEWVRDARWVDAGKCVTSSGVAAGTDMALAVIARLWGLETAERIAALTEFEWHRDADTDPFTRYLDQGDIAAAMPVTHGTP
jgi:transcriptional regulator GlxA family with amidase domain